MMQKIEARTLKFRKITYFSISQVLFFKTFIRKVSKKIIFSSKLVHHQIVLEFSSNSRPQYQQKEREKKNIQKYVYMQMKRKEDGLNEYCR